MAEAYDEVLRDIYNRANQKANRMRHHTAGLAAVAAAGWDAAVKALVDESGEPLDVVTNSNPFREADHG